MKRYLRFSAYQSVLLLGVSFLLFGLHTFNVISLIIATIGAFCWHLSAPNSSHKHHAIIIGIILATFVNILGLSLYAITFGNIPKTPTFTGSIVLTEQSKAAEDLYIEFADFSEKQDALSTLPEDVFKAISEKKYDDPAVKKAFDDTVEARLQIENMLKRGPMSVPKDQLTWDGKLPRYTILVNWMKLELYGVYRYLASGRFSEAEKRYSTLWDLTVLMYNGNQIPIGASVTRALTIQLVEFPFSLDSGRRMINKASLSAYLKQAEEQMDGMFARSIDAEYYTFKQSVDAMSSAALIPSSNEKATFPEKLLYGYIARWPFFDKEDLTKNTHAMFLSMRGSYTIPYYTIVEKTRNDSKTEYKRPPFYKNILGNVFYNIAMPSYDMINFGKEKAKSEIICLRAYLEGGLTAVEKAVDPLTGKPFVVSKTDRILRLSTEFIEKNEPAWKLEIIQ